MHLTTAPLAFGRRLGILCLALFAACGLLTGTAKPAHADTSQRWTVINWDTTGYETYVPPGAGTNASNNNARSYEAVIERLRSTVSHPIPYAPAGILDSQERQTDNITEIRIWRNGRHDVSLYYGNNNLYLLGFSVDGAHWRFSDTGSFLAREWQNASPPGTPLPLFQSLGYSGNYNSLDSARDRQYFSLNSVDITAALQGLRDIRTSNANDARRRLAAIIGFTSEAARFGYIQRRTASIIQYGRATTGPNAARDQYMGRFGMEIQYQWSRLSQIVHQSMIGHPTNPVAIDGQTFRNVTDISEYNSDRRITPFISLWGSR
ncbi:ribosome-inactivating family protein [Streptomyces sp. NPDC006656]|uniref:ribosome-inactivating family protein n=1 Tax=Streptomyces sp. NPDC006656 TaxID=3156899 RepID=UPI003454101F